MRRTACLLLSLTVGVSLFLYRTHSTTGPHVPRIGSVSKLNDDTGMKQPVVDIGVLQDLDVEFLPNFKNPCWFEARGTTDEQRVRWANTSTRISSSLQRLQSKIKSDFILQCLPYFFLIGQPKCATTDIFHRINIHPDVVEPKLKGPHWWTRKRFGPPYATKPVTLSEYLSLFNTTKIEEAEEAKTLPNITLTSWASKRITGDSSTSTLWDSSPSMGYLHSFLTSHPDQSVFQRLLEKRHNSSNLPGNMRNWMLFEMYEYELEYSNGIKSKYDHSKGVVLPFTVADVIHSVLPKSRMIAVIREPISRLYSSYLFFTKNIDLSPQHFDESVKSSIDEWRECTALYSDRICAYNKTIQNNMKVRLHNGLYCVFLEDWLKVFPQEQVLVVRMEDYHSNVTQTVATIYNHLGLRPLTDEEEKRVRIAPVRNKNKKKAEIGEMLNSTIDALRKFYQPYNRKLSHILKDSKFMWDDIL